MTRNPRPLREIISLTDVQRCRTIPAMPEARSVVEIERNCSGETTIRPVPLAANRLTHFCASECWRRRGLVMSVSNSKPPSQAWMNWRMPSMTKVLVESRNDREWRRRARRESCWRIGSCDWVGRCILSAGRFRRLGRSSNDDPADYGVQVGAVQPVRALSLLCCSGID
jgi:hypothetical protein